MPDPGRLVLVVGASRGIGRVIAEHLVAGGFQVIGTVRSQSAAEAVRTGGVVPLVLDVTDRASVRALPDRVAKLAPGGLHALVYNAGKSVAGRRAAGAVRDPDRRAPAAPVRRLPAAGRP